MKRLLVVSPHFPPINAPDAQRIRTALPYLRKLGWDPTILCVAPEYVDSVRDEQSVENLPHDIRIVRCAAWPLSVSRRLGMRTLGMRAKRSMHRTGRGLIRELQPDLIFFTTTQYGIVTLGRRWHREFQVPYLIDLQDPWLTDYYEKAGAPPAPGGWKYKIARALAALQEPPTFEAASGFVSVSPEYLTTLEKRYTWFQEKPKSVIPFGVVPEEYETAIATVTPAFKPDPQLIQLVSVGAIGAIMEPALVALLSQIKSLRDKEPQLATRLRLLFYGTSYAPADQAQPSVMQLADELGLGDIIQETPQRIPMSAALATMHAADGLIILTSDDPAYSPSKLAGCFLANRPCLLITSLSSRAEQLANELGLAKVLDIEGTTPAAISEFIDEVGSTSNTWKDRRKVANFHAHHTAEARTRQLTGFFDTLIS